MINVVHSIFTGSLTWRGCGIGICPRATGHHKLYLSIYVPQVFEIHWKTYSYLQKDMLAQKQVLSERVAPSYTYIYSVGIQWCNGSPISTTHCSVVYSPTHPSEARNCNLRKRKMKSKSIHWQAWYPSPCFQNYKDCQRRQDLGKWVRCIDWSFKVKKFGWEEWMLDCLCFAA